MTAWQMSESTLAQRVSVSHGNNAERRKRRDNCVSEWVCVGISSDFFERSCELALCHDYYYYY